MHALVDGKWEEGYLDYHLRADSLRIDVELWTVLSSIENQYVSYSTSDWRKVWNYLWDVGPYAVFKKIVSRLNERGRNDKRLSVGLGEVVDSTSDQFEAGTSVAFLAYNHPPCVDRIVVDERFAVARDDDGVRPRTPEDELLFFDEAATRLEAGRLERYAGWSPFSDWNVDATEVETELDRLARELERYATGVGEPSRRLSIEPARTTCERRAASITGASADPETTEAILYGLGNYAKSVVQPNLVDDVQLTGIHELDPLQLGRADDWDRAVDTAGEMRDDESPDAVFAAGYHHTHTPIALQALERGAQAVVEKPLCTSYEQLERLRSAIEREGRHVFAGFHKRYSPLNDWLMEDLDPAPDQPLHYACIVYEIPLPELHWYNWPASGSRLVSNGCHWLDHFMYLNDYLPVRECGVMQASHGELTVMAELDNGASFSMTLTDRGSPRLGVRDHVEVRTDDATATLVDNAEYRSENAHTVIRRDEIDGMASYADMYRTISSELAAGEPGDPVRSLRSTKLMLDLERQLQGGEVR